MTEAVERAWPVRLRFQAGARRLVAEFDDDAVVAIPYTRLRAQSPSAEVQGHGAGPKPPAPVVPDDISVTKAEPVGRYAVRIHFSDGHSSGLFTWAYLRTLSMPET